MLDLSNVALYAEGLLAVLIPDEADDACAVQLRKVKEIFGDRSYLALTLRRRPNDQLRLHELNTLAIRQRVRPVVTNDVLFHEPGRRQLQDVVTCIRHRTTIDRAGFLRERHADRFLKLPEEMHRLPKPTGLLSGRSASFAVGLHAGRDRGDRPPCRASRDAPGQGAA